MIRKYMPKSPPAMGIPRGDQRWATFLKNHARGIIVCDFLRRSDNHFSNPLRVGGDGACFASIDSPRHDGPSHRRVDSATAARGHPNRPRVSFHHPRPRRDLFRRIGRFADPARSRGDHHAGAQPQANSLCERLIGTLRRECLDWIIPQSEGHLSKVLASWMAHYNRRRPHSALGPGIPDPRLAEAYSVMHSPNRTRTNHLAALPRGKFRHRSWNSEDGMDLASPGSGVPRPLRSRLLPSRLSRWRVATARSGDEPHIRRSLSPYIAANGSEPRCDESSWVRAESGRDLNFRMKTRYQRRAGLRCADGQVPPSFPPRRETEVAGRTLTQAECPKQKTPIRRLIEQYRHDSDSGILVPASRPTGRESSRTKRTGRALRL